MTIGSEFGNLGDYALFQKEHVHKVCELNKEIAQLNRKIEILELTRQNGRSNR
jgi:hypothetical protein